MGKRQVIIAEMTGDTTRNGVYRYIEMLCEGLPTDLYEIIRLKFVYFKELKLPKYISHAKYVEIIFPLSFGAGEIRNKEYWHDEYYKVALYILEPYLKKNGVIHIQTMNLIRLATHLRQKYKFKIVSHIHCIPWKYLYSTNRKQFNSIFNRLYVEKKIGSDDLKSYVTKDEYNILKESDAIICVTRSAKDYYEKYLGVPECKLHCIHNGISSEWESYDIFGHTLCMHDENKSPTNLLFVGSVTKEKGFHYILEALRIVKTKGYAFELKVAGKIEGEILTLVENEYADLNIKFMGVVDYTKLCSLYQSSHIGLIPSLFEQCSYVALEMSMFGLPVLYSDIAELHEIFSIETEMSIPLNFSLHGGLCLDISVFAQKLIHLIESRDLRELIGRKNRERYIQHFGLDQMINKTINVYKNIFSYENKS